MQQGDERGGESFGSYWQNTGAFGTLNKSEYQKPN